MAQPQNFKNHTRFDPPFHFFLLPVFLVNIGLSITYCVKHYHQHAHLAPWWIVMSVAMFVAVGLSRGYALKTGPHHPPRREAAPCLAGIAEQLVELDSLTIKQYVALRFASNPELPELARRAIRENLTPKQIKESVVAWRADYDRV